MRHLAIRLSVNLLFLGFLTNSEIALGFEAKCIKTKVIRGSHCNNLLIDFDFSDCGVSAPVGKTVRSQCVNRKAVSFVKTSDALYITTYAAPLDEGGAWRFLTTRKEERAGSGKPEAGIASGVVEVSIPVVPMPKMTDKTETSLPAVENPDKIIETPAVASEVPVKSVAAHVSEVKFTGLFDFYYINNSNNPSAVTAPSAGNPFPPVGNNVYRAFDQYHDTFSLALAQIGIEKKIAKSNLRIELGFGGDTAVISPNDLASQNVLQAYLKQELIPGIHLYAGKMLTHMGLETPYSNENWNYSRSLLFTYAIPLWHNGLALEFEFIPKSLSATAFIYNNWSGVYENNKMKTAGFRLAYVLDPITINYNFIGGNEANNINQQRQVHEANLTLNLGGGFALAGDYIYGTETIALNGIDVSWSAISAALKWTMGFYSLATRYEAYSDSNGYTVAGQYKSTGAPLVQELSSLTLTNGFDMGGGAKTILEFRQDQSNKMAFTDMNGLPAQTQFTSSLSFLYQF